MRALIIFISVFICLSSCAQGDTSLLNKAKNQLKTNGDVSKILTDPSFLSIHPETGFRDLIEEYAGTSILRIATPSEPGRKIRVLVTVRDKNGKPIPNVLVYLYQTDSRGWYAANAPHVGGNEGDMGHARLFGYVRTDKDGKFELHTVKPSGYPQSDLPAHIHIHFQARGYQNHGTELLFDDDERLVGEIRNQSERNQFLISKPEPVVAPFEQQFSYSITLDDK